MADAPAQAVPFTIGSAFTSRQAFELPQQALGSGTVQPTGFPLNLGSFGWVASIILKFTLTFTAGANTAFGADGINNVIDRIGVRTSGGAPLIQPVTGYQLYLDNKYGGKPFGPTAAPAGTDPNQLPGTSLAITESAANTLTFFRALQFQVDPTSALGCIPATASNREFTIDLTLGSLGTVFPTGAPAAANVSISATAWYWDIPADGAVPFGVTAQSQTLRLLQVEQSPVNAGSNKTKSTNVGNIIMNHYLVFRDGNGIRQDADWSNPFEVDIDNNPRLWFDRQEWQAHMANWFGLGKSGQAIDTVGGLDSGVYVIPWAQLAGGAGNSPVGSHAQYLATLNTSQLVFNGYNYGAAGSLNILTDALSTPNAAFAYSR